MTSLLRVSETLAAVRDFPAAIGPASRTTVETQPSRSGPRCRNIREFRHPYERGGVCPGPLQPSS